MTEKERADFLKTITDIAKKGSLVAYVEQLQFQLASTRQRIGVQQQQSGHRSRWTAFQTRTFDENADFCSVLEEKIDLAASKHQELRHLASLLRPNLYKPTAFGRVPVNLNFTELTKVVPTASKPEDLENTLHRLRMYGQRQGFTEANFKEALIFSTSKEMSKFIYKNDCLDWQDLLLKLATRFCGEADIYQKQRDLKLLSRGKSETLRALAARAAELLSDTAPLHPELGHQSRIDYELKRIVADNVSADTRRLIHAKTAELLNDGIILSCEALIDLAAAAEANERNEQLVLNVADHRPTEPRTSTEKLRDLSREKAAEKRKNSKDTLVNRLRDLQSISGNTRSQQQPIVVPPTAGAAAAKAAPSLSTSRSSSATQPNFRQRSPSPSFQRSQNPSRRPSQSPGQQRPFQNQGPQRQSAVSECCGFHYTQTITVCPCKTAEYRLLARARKEEKEKAKEMCPFGCHTPLTEPHDFNECHKVLKLMEDLAATKVSKNA